MPQPNRNNSTEAPDFAQAGEVDSGVYFQRARAWSRMLYDFPIVERSYALLALFIIWLTLLLAIIIFFSFDPLVRPVRVPFENPNSGEDIPRIVTLSGRDRAPLQKSVARYIAQHYAVARENYRYDRETIDSQYRLVYNLSAPDVFDAYRSTLQPSNPQSPLARFERHTTLQALYPVTELEVSAPSRGLVRGQARVTYTERINGPGGYKQARRSATFEFTMSEISVHKEDNRVYQYNDQTGQDEKLTGAINFRVTRYQSPTESPRP